MLNETAVAILAKILTNAGAIGLGLARKKIKGTRISFIIIARVLRQNKISRPYLFLFFNVFLRKEKIQRSLVTEKISGTIRASHSDLETLYTIYLAIKQRHGQFTALTACTQIVKNLR